MKATTLVGTQRGPEPTWSAEPEKESRELRWALSLPAGRNGNGPGRGPPGATESTWVGDHHRATELTWVGDHHRATELTWVGQRQINLGQGPCDSTELTWVRQHRINLGRGPTVHLPPSSTPTHMSAGRFRRHFCRPADVGPDPSRGPAPTRRKWAQLPADSGLSAFLDTPKDAVLLSAIFFCMD